MNVALIRTSTAKYRAIPSHALVYCLRSQKSKSTSQSNYSSRSVVVRNCATFLRLMRLFQLGGIIIQKILFARAQVSREQSLVCMKETEIMYSMQSCYFRLGRERNSVEIL